MAGEKRQTCWHKPYTETEYESQITLEFLSLSRRRSSSRNVPSGEERGETAVFAGYDRTCFQSVCVEKRWPPAIERVIGLGEVPF